MREPCASLARAFKHTGTDTYPDMHTYIRRDAHAEPLGRFACARCLRKSLRKVLARDPCASSLAQGPCARFRVFQHTKYRHPLIRTAFHAHMVCTTCLGESLWIESCLREPCARLARAVHNTYRNADIQTIRLRKLLARELARVACASPLREQLALAQGACASPCAR